MKAGIYLGKEQVEIQELPLPVIPHLKLTDMGLVDVDKFQLLT